MGSWRVVGLGVEGGGGGWGGLGRGVERGRVEREGGGDEVDFSFLCHARDLLVWEGGMNG